MNTQDKIVIGAYPYRGNVHICRLLCEYLGLQYQNKYFDPLTWKKFQQQETYDWTFQELPFLKDDTFVITQSLPMCNYIIHKTQNLELLGKTLDDMLIVDKFFWGRDLVKNFLSLVVENKNNPTRLVEEMKRNWVDVKQILLEHEKEAKSSQDFYLGYLTIIDFMIHEIFEYFRDIFKSEINNFPKLMSIRNRVAQIPSIQSYESSDRTIKNKCPLEFYRKWKLEAMKAHSFQQQ